MFILNPAKKFWFGVPRNAEGAEGGAGEGSSGAEAEQGAGEIAAGADAPAPASTFLSEAGKPPEGEAPKEGSEGLKEGEAPAAFDAAALTLPEGFELDEEVGKSFTEVLGDEKLSPQERGQKLVELHATAMQSAVTKLAEESAKANMDLWTKTNEEWRTKIAELPEFKGNPDAEAGKVIQALTAVGAGEDFFKALDMTGAGNHPAILQILHRLTKPFIEGGAVGGEGGAKPARQLGSNIYTSTKT